jgi:hypothetical protein
MVVPSQVKEREYPTPSAGRSMLVMVVSGLMVLMLIVM